MLPFRLIPVQGDAFHFENLGRQVQELPTLRSYVPYLLLGQHGAHRVPRKSRHRSIPQSLWPRQRQPQSRRVPRELLDVRAPSIFFSLHSASSHSRSFFKKTATGFDFSIPTYKATDFASYTWVERDVGRAALVLLKHYTDPSKNISGKSYPVINATISCAELVNLASKGEP
jgi:hypothetical protein